MLPEFPRIYAVIFNHDNSRVVLFDDFTDMFRSFVEVVLSLRTPQQIGPFHEGDSSRFPWIDA